MMQYCFKYALLLVTTCSFALVRPVVAVAEKPAAVERPNILLVFTDDQRADTIHALGNPAIITPNLDRLTERGFVFNNAYIMGSNSPAVCLPSRNMLMSGRAYFHFRRYKLPDRRHPFPYASPEEPNVPTTLGTAGYETYHHGKKGNTARRIHPLFDHTKYVTHHSVLKNGQPGKVVVDRAIDFLKHRKTDKPFVMYLAFSEPHDPRVSAQEYRDMYDRDEIPLPKNYLPIHPFDNGEMTIRDERLEKWPRTKDAIRRHLHDYYAMITGLDHHIGRLFQALKDQGLYDNTIVVFASDNGLALGSHGLMGKQSVYEHSVKVPLIVAGPSIPHGDSDALVYLLDLFPTFCEWAGTPVPEELDGKSLAPIIAGRSEKVRDTAFFAYRGVQRAVRDGCWKLICYPRIDRTQLFDLSTDPDETHDLSADPAQARRIESMMKLMRRWQERLGDDAPLVVDQPADGRWTPPARKPKKNKAISGRRNDRSRSIVFNEVNLLHGSP
ncbi:MAG: sulfatase-like hydrolase/transferase [Pirellulales bacterium]|nr:sulfatase-like hydrolase/transferase [Pirellulales bacterium]